MTTGMVHVMKHPVERTAAAEKAAFSERLRRAIADFDAELLSATVLAREFNRRSRLSSVGKTAAHKWLSGEAIPQQEKLTVLAQWLCVPVQWLRYGEAAAETPVAGRDRRRLDKLTSDFASLSERDKKLVEHLIRGMLRS